MKKLIIGKLFLAILAVAVLGGAVMLLWNAVVPTILAGARPIDYPHALGLLVLCRILFAGFRGHPGHPRHHRFGGPWRHMTAEERRRWREEWRQRWEARRQ